VVIGAPQDVEYGAALAAADQLGERPMPTKKPTYTPDEGPKDGDEDVEGHSMMPIDPSSARHLARAREQEIRQHLSKHDLERDARPHKKER
jgi:hypothetical protein